jgi:tetratricopeptide (TPR) repeat protein/tRNA A-37 threonylcarbamoyl transferase component Bud32
LTEDDTLASPSLGTSFGEQTGPQRRAFVPGELAAERYRVLRFIAQGAMGEVYEAEDLELRERVALKTIKPEIARDPRAMERFRREVHLARRVTHPNICRIFDVSRHKPEEASADEIAFLTMELLSGETLAERVRRCGRLPTGEALPLARQLAAALDAAHDAGVVHRDFKSGNVVLAPPTASAEGVRAVVTDFGLAIPATADESSPSLTATGAIVGTPAYIAPEQLESGRVTASADIYALGVVLYEMVTGTWPFVGESPMSTAVKRLTDPPTPPRRHVPDLDAAWERAILRCLEHDPADRFARAGDVIDALGSGAGARTAAPRRAAAGWAAALLFAIVAGLLAWSASRVPTAPAPPAARAVPMAPRRAVAVLGFKNLSGKPDSAWLATALAEMLTTELAAGERLRLIPGEDVARMKLELSLADAESFSRDTLSRIRAHIGPDVLVLGSYVTLGRDAEGQIRLDLRLQDAQAGETLWSVAEAGTEARLFELVSRLGARLRQVLGVEPLSAADAKSVRAALPANSEAARLYAEGLSKLRIYDALTARSALERAVGADPSHALAHSALSAAWSSLGYDARAQEAAKRAFELSAGMSREDRLFVEGRFRESTKDWPRAVEVYQALKSFFPDSLEYGVRLASAQVAGGRGAEALETVASLRKLPAPSRDDPRIDIAEALAARSISDFAREQAAEAAAARKGRSLGARLLVARARLTEVLALASLGRHDEARAAGEEARQLYEAAGDRNGAANALSNVALVLWQQGELAEAGRLYEAALLTYRAIGNKGGLAGAVNGVAIVLWQRGDLEGARRRYQEVLALRRETGDRNGIAATSNNLAVVLWQQGDVDAARRMHEEALGAFRDIGNKSGAAASLNNLGELHKRVGDLKAALRAHDEALALRREIGEKSGVGASLSNIARILLKQGDLRGARAKALEALDLSRSIGQKSLLADTLASLGDVALAEGNFPAARQAHEEAAALREEVGDTGAEAESSLGLAALSVEEGRPGEAEASLRQIAATFA